MKKTAEEIKTRVGEILGEVSMCWSETPKGVFQSSKAVDLLTEVFALMEEYRSQASELPSDDEIETYEHDVTNKYGESMSNHQTDDGFAAWEIGMKQMRSIASPLLASHVARIKELEDNTTKFAEWLQLKRWYSFTNGKWNYTFEHGTSISAEEYDKNYRKTTEELYSEFCKTTPPKP